MTEINPFDFHLFCNTVKNRTGRNSVTVNNGNVNSERHAPELKMNAPRARESWTSPNGDRNRKEVLYLKDSDVKVYTRFQSSLAMPGGFTLDLNAVAPNVAIGGLESKTVTFNANGISTGVSIAGVNGFVEFAANESTASAVNKEVSAFDWNVTKIVNKTDGTGKALTTDAVTFYTVLDVPVSSTTSTSIVSNFALFNCEVSMQNIGGTIVTSGATTTVTGGSTSTSMVVGVSPPTTVTTVGDTTTIIVPLSGFGSSSVDLVITSVGGTSAMNATLDKRTFENFTSVHFGIRDSGTTSSIGNITIVAGTTILHNFKLNNSLGNFWDANDSPSSDDLNQPWISALEFTIETAGVRGAFSAETALTRLTTFLHDQDDLSTTDLVEGHSLQYDTTDGAPAYLSSVYLDSVTRQCFMGCKFDTADYINKTHGNVVNCYDQAAALTVFGQLLGINVEYAFSQPFGYIKETTLVGDVRTNNPFHGAGGPYVMFNATTVTPDATYTLIVGMDASGNPVGRTFFGNHAFAVYDGKVYDACGGPVTGLPASEYFDSIIDFDANAQDNQKSGKSNFAENPCDVRWKTMDISSLIQFTI
ncbi:MAG: hypothetical protein Q4D38_14105 [Planctomycetia bacterium]|nr:hypothetical protein [Planctomycetia bacterium]